MTGKWLKLIISILILLVGKQELKAQIPVERNTNSWWSLVGKVQLNNGIAIGEQVHIRRTHFINNWQQLVIRPFVEWGKNPNVKFVTGITYIQHYPYGENPATGVNCELNGYMQGTFRAPVNRSQLAIRLRLEERYMWPDHRNRLLHQRIRFRAQVKKPLFTVNYSKRHVWLKIEDEIFFNTHLHSSTFGVNQNRLQTGLVYFPTQQLGFEAGFMCQSMIRSEPLPLQQNYTGIFKILWKLDRKKKS